MTNLISAVQAALDGSVSHAGETVPVYVRGHVGDEVPAIVIERPETDGTEYMDGSSTQSPRLRVRVHDRKGNTHGGVAWYVMRSAEIANKTHDVLNQGVSVDGSTIAFLEPNRRPVTYEVEGQSASDLILLYDLFLP